MTATVIGRIAAILALIGAFVVVLLLIFGGSEPYKVTAKFENASQLVEGNTVAVAGVKAGTVEKISLGDDGQALVEMKVDETYAPLYDGTIATIRSQSLSGIANRYVAFDLPSEDKRGEEIENGGTIEQQNTVAEVDLDQFFATLDEETIESFKRVIKGFARSYTGVGEEANKGFHYLNPFLSTSRRLFGELNSDEAALERLIVDTAGLTSTLAGRSTDLDRLVNNLDLMMNAIGNQDDSLRRAIAALPDFMRQFNTTAVNLRVAVDDLDPLIKASNPVLKKLIPFTRKLRKFARGSVPTLRDLSNIIRRQGRDNDLVELTNLQVPLAAIGVGPIQRNGASRAGALPASSKALRDSLPQLAHFRPYVTIEGASGWFDDFGHSGVYDANGGMGRISTTFNLFMFSLPGIPDLTGPLSPQDRLNAVPTNFVNRCPGSNERDPGDGSTPFTDNGALDCDPGEVPTGP